MRLYSAMIGATIALLAASVPGVRPAAAQDAGQYVQGLAADMVAISKRPTAERRAFYNRFLAGEVDWTGPAVQALGPNRWAALAESDRQKLADWARDALMGYESAMRFIQNLIFQSCAVSGGSKNDVSGVRITCTRFGTEPLFGLRFEVARQGDRFKIADIGYIGVSLRTELAKEILKEDAVKEHGVHLDGVAMKK